MMAPAIPKVDVRRIRSHILRLPLFTRLIVLLIVGLWVASLQTAWDVRQWGSLIPEEIGLQTSMSSFARLGMEEVAGWEAAGEG